jgi:hypothetical protein
MRPTFRPLFSIAPCLPKPAKEPPKGPDWVHEIKHDGFRILARRNGDSVRLYPIEAPGAARCTKKASVSLHPLDWLPVGQCVFPPF